MIGTEVGRNFVGAPVADGAGVGMLIGKGVGTGEIDGDDVGMGAGTDVGVDVVDIEEGTGLGRCDTVGVVVGWLKTSPPATQKWSKNGAARSWK